MKIVNCLLVALTSLALLACSPDNSAKTKLFEEQRNALDKAKALENTLQQQAKENQQNIEKETQ